MRITRFLCYFSYEKTLVIIKYKTLSPKTLKIFALDLDGVHEFDGISLIEWSPNSLIKSLKEFGSSLPKYDPFEQL